MVTFRSVYNWIMNKRYAAGNPNSGSVMQKMGMKKEGIIRQSGTCNQGIVDEVYYSILRNEYFSNDN